MSRLAVTFKIAESLVAALTALIIAVVALGAVLAIRSRRNKRGPSSRWTYLRVSAVRRPAAAIGADPLVQGVRCTHIQQQRPSALRILGRIDALDAGE
jgi:hypothetical protein